MSTTLPFPSSGLGKGGTNAQDADAMKIDIPKAEKESAAAAAAPAAGGHHSTQPTHRKGGGGGGAHHHHHDTSGAAPAAATAQQGTGIGAGSGSTNGVGTGGVNVPPRGSSSASTAPATTAPHTWTHHPRQPNSGSDSYFPHAGMQSGASSVASSVSGAATSAGPPRTPGSIRNHSRQPSGSSAMVPNTAPPPSTGRKGGGGGGGGHNMALSLSTGAGAGAVGQQGEGFNDFGGGPPSPSTLTDIILALHSTLYGGKRTAEEVREMVSRFYDRDALFESPLLAASGREQIANQFIMAFTLPGMDVTSELRDVICSDFEFDGTRAGIIDQTISVTFLPSLFGKADAGGFGAKSGFAPQTGHPYDHEREGSSTPAYTLQSAVTPHPFASYSQAQTPAGQGSLFSRYGPSQSHSPTTPYSLSSMWGNSRPHTPGTHAGSSHIRPLSQSFRPSTPPSVNGDDDDATDPMGNSSTTIHGYDEQHFMSANEAGGGQVSRPQIPDVEPHYSHQGLGRGTVRAFLWGLFHPRAVLKSLCTIHLRLMSRLEFNDAGLIVRHEDTWGVRETIEGTIPFASLIYGLERRIVGYICSFAIGRGFRLSNALARHAIGPMAEKQSSEWNLEHRGGMHFDSDPNEAARALLLGYNRHEKIASMARSRASSPTRQRFSLHGPYTVGGHSRSRARSLVGGPHSAAPTRAASSDNLLSIGQGAGYGDRERGSTHGGETLPPDSSARYRTGSRRITTSTASAPVGASSVGLGASGTGQLDGPWQMADIYNASIDAGLDSKTRAPDRDGQ